MIPRHNNLLIQSENYKTWKKENNKKEIGNILLKHVYIPVFNLAQKGGGPKPLPPPPPHGSMYRSWLHEIWQGYMYILNLAICCNYM
jgi:hypothetical protein